jgi:DNA modification methylase
MMRDIVGDYTRPGDLVCDPCAGGATTLLAAYQTGRRAIGAELDPATYAKAKARLDRAMAQPHLFDPGLAKAVQNKMF